MSELTEAERFIFDRLTTQAGMSALVGSRIFNTAAPQTTPFPYVTFTAPPLMNEVRGIGTGSLQADPIFIVKAIDKGLSYDKVNQIAALIHTALHGKRDASGPVLACVREGAISYGEAVEGIEYRHRGGQYRVTVKPST